MSFLKFQSFSAACIVLLALAGCARDDELLSQENINKANDLCTQQVNLDQQLKVANWFTRWIACKKDKAMPFDIMGYPSKEKEIRAMYDQLMLLGQNVDQGTMLVQTVYKEWDTMQRKIGIKQCLIRQVQADGSSDCVRR
jgi:hypothetical protein